MRNLWHTGIRGTYVCDFVISYHKISIFPKFHLKLDYGNVNCTYNEKIDPDIRGRLVRKLSFA